MRDNYVYPAKITQENGNMTLSFIDFPDLIAVGESIDEVIEGAQEVLALTLIDYIEQKKELPSPSLLEEKGVYVNVWLPYYRNMSKTIYVKKTVTIPQWLDILAKERGINYSACMVKGIKEELGIN